MFELGTFLKIPRGTPDVPAMEFELKDIEITERRKLEIAYANKETAPELMQAFNTAYCSVTRMMAQVSYEYTQAKKYADKRRGVVILDIAPGLLASRGLKTSEDLRRAVIDQDEEYLALCDKVSMLEATYEYFRSKAKGFEMAYQSAKKIFDVTNGSLGSTHYALSMGVVDTHEQSPDPEPETLIGSPKYR